MKTLEPSAATKHRDIPVVVVEDEETVLSFLESSLRSSGFRNIYPCSDSATALRRLEAIPAGPVALIIDVALQADNGIDLATRLLSQRPGARVLLISGFIDEIVLPHEAAEQSRVRFLAKPFNFKQFSAEFDRLLAD